MPATAPAEMVSGGTIGAIGTSEPAGEAVAIASFVMRTKQYLAAIRPENGRLVLSTMIYADELVDPVEIGGLEGLDELEVSDAEITMANQLIETLAGDFEPEKYQDSYREQVLELIERKSNGEAAPVAAPAPAASADVVDLMAALEDEFGARVEEEKARAVWTVADIYRLVEETAGAA